jgi:hypothetical protein
MRTYLLSTEFVVEIGRIEAAKLHRVGHVEGSINATKNG